MYDKIYEEETNNQEESAKKKTLKERYAELNQDERNALATAIALSTGTLVTGIIIGGKLANNGKISAYDVPSRRLVRVRKKDLFRWIKKCNSKKWGVIATNEESTKVLDALNVLEDHGGTIEIKFDKE